MRRQVFIERLKQVANGFAHAFDEGVKLFVLLSVFDVIFRHPVDRVGRALGGYGDDGQTIGACVL